MRKVSLFATPLCLNYTTDVYETFYLHQQDYREGYLSARNNATIERQVKKKSMTDS